MHLRLILTISALLLLVVSNQAAADLTPRSFAFEAGVYGVSMHPCSNSFGVQATFGQNEEYTAGLLWWQGRESCRWKEYDVFVEENIGLTFSRRFRPFKNQPFLRRFAFELGAGVFRYQDFSVGSADCAIDNERVIDCTGRNDGVQPTFLLGVTFDVNDYIYIGREHFSTGGISEQNKAHEIYPYLGFKFPVKW